MSGEGKRKRPVPRLSLRAGLDDGWRGRKGGINTRPKGAGLMRRENAGRTGSNEEAGKMLVRRLRATSPRRRAKHSRGQEERTMGSAAGEATGAIHAER